MSHYPLLVISTPDQDLEEQLEPFGETYDYYGDYDYDDDSEVQKRWDTWEIGGIYQDDAIPTKDSQKVTQCRIADVDYVPGQYYIPDNVLDADGTWHDIEMSEFLRDCSLDKERWDATVMPYIIDSQPEDYIVTLVDCHY